MQITTALLRKISPAGAKFAANMNSVIVAVNGYGQRIGLDQPHRQAHFLCQLAHESGDFRYDQEIASGAAYENRKDLGNTQKGDGKRFKGRTAMQVTGRANYRDFTVWVRKLIPDAPDFEKQPARINEDPFEGLGPLWYWDTRKLNRYADQNNIEMITKKINGGLNGFDDRKFKYVRAALAILDESLAGQQKAYVLAFQKKAGFTGEALDGDPGPQTRAELHKRLVRLTGKPERSDDVQAAPVVAKEAVPVKVAELEGSTALSADTLAAAGGVAVPAIGALNGLDWKVAIALIAVAAAIGGFMIWRRSAMAARQDAKAQEITARSTL